MLLLFFYESDPGAADETRRFWPRDALGVSYFFVVSEIFTNFVGT